MRGMRGTTSGRFNVESYYDSTWESGGATTPVDPPDGKRGQDVQDVLPNEGGTAAMGGCPGGIATRTAMRVHFVHRHVQDTVVVL